MGPRMRTTETSGTHKHNPWHNARQRENCTHSMHSNSSSVSGYWSAPTHVHIPLFNLSIVSPIIATILLRVYILQLISVRVHHIVVIVDMCALCRPFKTYETADHFALIFDIHTRGA
jgi:hypothetical protein